MADENSMPSNGDPANTDPSATPSAGADEPTVLHNAQASTEMASTDESTQIIAPATPAASAQETVAAEIASEQTILMAPAGLPNTAEQAGATFPVEVAAPGAESASGPLFAEQGYPATVAYGQPGYPQDMYQQPSMPLQPGQTAFAPAPRKRRTGLWVALIIVIVLLLGSGTVFAFVASQQQTNTPTQALQQFCDGYKALDAQKVYDTLSSASKSHTSLTQLQQSFDEVKGLSSFAKFSACTVSNVQQKDTTATGTITLTITVSFGSISSTTSVPMPMQLVLENHTWKVDATKMGTPSTIPTFPPDFLTPTVQGSNQ